MDTSATVRAIAGPIGDLAAAFYFSPASVARAEGIGLDVVSLYGAGRGSVLGDATPAEVDAVFYFFKPGMIAGVVEKGRSLASNDAIKAAHLAAADDFAEEKFAGIASTTLEAFADAAASVAADAPSGSWPLFDGYRSAPIPASPAARAYRGAILLRELRGGVHTDAVKAAGLSAATACQFDRDDFYFRMHGFGDDDVVEMTPEVEALKASTEAATDLAMASLLDHLTTEQQQALIEGTEAFAAALA